MKWLKNLFGRYEKAQCAPVPPMPPWEDVISLMYNRGLDALCGEVIRVFYSGDKSKRCVVLKDEKGFFKYHFEELYQFDEQEWKYTHKDQNTLPAMWETLPSQCGGSLFEREEDLMRDLVLQPEYKQYFNLTI